MRDDLKYKIFNNIKDDIYIELNEEDKYIKIINKEILKITTFSDLFSSRRSSIGLIEDVNSGPSIDLSQGRTYDASRMWSPISPNFNSYEFYRGIIGISSDGEVLTEKLDGTMFHHADRTVVIANSLGANIEETLAPFEAGINASSEGILILQFEGDAGLVYFPPSISASQLDGLLSALIPRSGYEFQFAYGDKIFEEQSYRQVIDFAVNLSRSVGVRR